MPYPAKLFIHQCSIVQVRAGPGTDDYGNPVQTETEISGCKCRFQTAQGAIDANGAYYVLTCIVPPQTGVREDDIIVSHGKRYWVNSVKQVFEPASSRVSYIVLALRETAERKEAV